MNYLQKEKLALTSSSVSEGARDLGPQPVVVSAEAEALSHSETTMKLTHRFDLFQLLLEVEGGRIPHTVAGNELRDSDVLKVGMPDTLWDMKLTDYKGLGGKEKI